MASGGRLSWRPLSLRKLRLVIFLIGENLFVEFELWYCPNKDSTENPRIVF
jgi:hypothetical protein